MSEAGTWSKSASKLSLIRDFNWCIGLYTPKIEAHRYPSHPLAKDGATMTRSSGPERAFDL